MVAARDGTDKILRARQVQGCVVVKALWLTECLWSLTLRSVTPHLLGATGVSSKSTTGKTQSRLQMSSSSDSSDDDELAAALESELMDL